MNANSDTSILATGYIWSCCVRISKRLSDDYKINIGVLDLFDLSSCEGQLSDYIGAHSALITLEEGFTGRGGMDSLIFDWASNFDFNGEILNIGVRPGYKFELGTRQEIHEAVGIGEEEILDRILKFCTKP